MMSDLRSLAETEIINRHRFFVDWFTGKALDSEIDVCARAFASDMRIIWPDASEHDRLPLIELLRSGRNSSTDDFEITVNMHHAVQLSPDLLLITFDEHQTSSAGNNSRRATALFSRDDDAPEGVVWRYLHQTWIA